MLKGLISGLKVVTESRGDSYTFSIPRKQRRAVKAWLAQVKR